MASGQAPEPREGRGCEAGGFGTKIGFCLPCGLSLAGERNAEEGDVPTYDYRCAKGHRYEKVEPFGSPSEHPCDKCGAVAKRQLSVPALAFKGSGFYKTDSRKSGSNSGSGSSGSSSSSERWDSSADSDPA